MALITKNKNTKNDKIPSNWNLSTIDKIKSQGNKSIISGPFGSNIGKKYFVDSGIPVIRGNNLTNDLRRFMDDGFVYVTHEKAFELNTWAIKGDIIFTAAGTIGQVGIIEDNAKYDKYIISNKQLRLRVNEEIVRPLYVFYWFSRPEMVQYIQQRNTGSTIPLINLSVLKKLPIVIPPIEEQDRILNILSSLDDKIELNNQMNKTLEQMARAIFNRWFVEFEFPLGYARGKPSDHEQQRLPRRLPSGVEAAEASGYKSSGGVMIDSELGMIPEGWGITYYTDMIDVLGGGTPSKKEDKYWNNGDIPFFTPKDANDSTYVISTEDHITNIGLENCNSKLYEKNIVFITARGTVGKIILAGQNMAMNQSCYALKGKDDINQYFVYMLTKSIIDNLAQHAHGSVFSTITTDTFKKFKVIKPDINLINEFGKCVEPIFEKLYSNTLESRTLSLLRDTLLPKLMSGELRVPPEKVQLYESIAAPDHVPPPGRCPACTELSRSEPAEGDRGANSGGEQGG